MNLKKSAQQLSNGLERAGEWSEVTRGERYIIRASSEETSGAYSKLEIVAGPRNGVPMHIHDNEEEHFVILKGQALIANGNNRAEMPPVRPSPREACPMPGLWLRANEATP